MFSVLNGGASVTAAKIAGPAVNLKILVPAVASGAIIGKGGETIAEIQKQTGTRIKMSKANDFYPGTTERVGLLQGTYLIFITYSDPPNDCIANLNIFDPS